MNSYTGHSERYEKLVDLYMAIKNVDIEKARMAVDAGCVKVVNLKSSEELARKMVKNGRFGSVSKEIMECVDYSKLAEILLRSGYHKTPGGLVYTNDRLAKELGILPK